MEIKVGKVYKLMKKIGAGAFGEIYQAMHIVTKELVAVKLEPVTTLLPQLEYEHNLYKVLQG
jgi:serine/threonine protein kinase